MQQCRRSLLFQTMNSVSSNSLSFQYQRLASSGCRDKGVRKFEYVENAKFLCIKSCEDKGIKKSDP